MFALTDCYIFTGEQWLEQHAVLIDHGRIIAVVPQAELDAKVVQYSQAAPCYAPVLLIYSSMAVAASCLTVRLAPTP